MCGIAGTFSTQPDAQAAGQAERLIAALRHRGPDDEGSYLSPDGQAMMIHTRLAILDLSAAGHQPMAAGHLKIVFNGEIYNFRELRAELMADGVEFQTGTDTEVILALYAKTGAECVKRLRGMFAFAIWDEAAGTRFWLEIPWGSNRSTSVSKADGWLSLRSCGR
jgi:asparagine synthase (glutamine-hydrolysing)